MLKTCFVIMGFLMEGIWVNPDDHRWGFFAHRKINRHAVFTLPTEMIGFYKANISYIEENAISPDLRRYTLENEAPRHYIDLDVYGDAPFASVPIYWDSAVYVFSEDTLMKYGIVPWHIYTIKNYLTSAFLEKDPEKIIRLSADLGHYIADANVPLHTTLNYNGQLTGQNGIHGFWESRLPELFFDEYLLFTGKAEYIRNTQVAAWAAVEQAFNAKDSVLLLEKALSQDYDQDRKYSFEQRGNRTVKVYSQEYSDQYHAMLNGMVERQLKMSIKMVGNFWFTCWVDAGQPNLDDLEKIEHRRDSLPGDSGSDSLRQHESGIKNE